MATQTAKSNGKAHTISTADLSMEIETLRQDISSLAKTMSDLARVRSAEAADDVRSHGLEAAEIAKAKAEELRDRAEDAGEVAKARAQALQGQANDFVKEQPAMALGIAAGVGFLVGLIGSRK